MTCPTLTLRVSTNDAFACTSTCSETWPTCKVILILGLSPTWRTIPDCAKVRKPGSDASNLYGPRGRFGRTYNPVSFATVMRLMPVSVCVAVTSTPGKTPPLESWTTPLIWAVACAQRPVHVINKSNTATKRFAAILLILPPPSFTSSSFGQFAGESSTQVIGCQLNLAVLSTFIGLSSST